MKEFSYTITDPAGIHARPAGELVKEAAKYRSNIILDKQSKTADAKKIFAVMGLGVKNGEHLTIRINGEDEDNAAQALEEFFKLHF